MHMEPLLEIVKSFGGRVANHMFGVSVSISYRKAPVLVVGGALKMEYIVREWFKIGIGNIGCVAIRIDAIHLYG